MEEGTNRCIKCQNTSWHGYNDNKKTPRRCEHNDVWRSCHDSRGGHGEVLSSNSDEHHAGEPLPRPAKPTPLRWSLHRGQSNGTVGGLVPSLCGQSCRLRSCDGHSKSTLLPQSVWEVENWLGRRLGKAIPPGSSFIITRKFARPSFSWVVQQPPQRLEYPPPPQRGCGITTEKEFSHRHSLRYRIL